MIFYEEFTLNVPHTEAWEFFTDFPGPIKIIPGLVSLNEKEPDHYTGTARIKIGPFNCLFEGEVKILSVNHEEQKVVLEGGAKDNVLGAHFEGTAYAHTVPEGANQCKVLLEVPIGLGGTLGKLGKLILKPRARSIVDNYRQLCERELERRRQARAASSNPPASTQPNFPETSTI